jgi:hypothetical protein
MGSDGLTQQVHVNRLSPCHLLDLDGHIDFTQGRPSKHLACRQCNFPDRAAQMVLCDTCPAAYHIGCLDPPLLAVPQGSWQCPACAAFQAGRLQHTDPEAEAAPPRADVSSTTDLEGRWCFVAQKQRDGTTRTRYAKVHTVADLTSSRPYELRYQDGEVLRASRRFVMRGILPAGFEPEPWEGQAQVLVAGAMSAAQLPDQFQFETTVLARRALTSLMPGDWSIGYLHALGALAEGMDAPGPPGAAHHVTHLTGVIDFSSISYVVDPWPYPEGQLEPGLPPHLQYAHLTDGPLLANLQPTTFRQAAAANMLDCIVSAPSVHALDILVGLSAVFVGRAAFFLAPITYISHAPGGRRQFLTRLAQAGRMRIALSSIVPPGKVQPVWVCIFASKGVQDLLVHPTQE